MVSARSLLCRLSISAIIPLLPPFDTVACRDRLAQGTCESAASLLRGCLDWLSRLPPPCASAPLARPWLPAGLVGAVHAFVVRGTRETSRWRSIWGPQST